ncbi:MAG: 4-hydroxy-tetrahydrodipicolinate reductase, partial [Lachnospiraceae bacterium]|nr:4-hydroxy-tetrahydrodipicolinate reductase [Lachnospiraceae bacterium]
MTKIILNGCNGRMGQVISAMAAEDPEMEIAAGVDMFDEGKNPYPVFKDITQCDVSADVIIDFSSPKAFDALMDHCIEKEIPVVVCTTGLSDDQLSRLEEASRQVAVLKSANMSLGVNLLIKLLKEAASVLAPAGFDVEIVEKHHNRKKDAPSGTAIALADSINEALGGEHDYVYDRSSRYEARSPREIGISAVRGGTIVGEHEVIFAGTDEVIEFKHTAYSRAI